MAAGTGPAVPARTGARGGGRAIGILAGPRKGCWHVLSLSFSSCTLLSQSEQQKKQQEAEKLHRQERKAVRRSPVISGPGPGRRPFH